MHSFDLHGLCELPHQEDGARRIGGAHAGGRVGRRVTHLAKFG